MGKYVLQTFIKKQLLSPREKLYWPAGHATEDH